MQVRRLVIGALALGLVGTAAPALAAKPKPKPVCFQITDEENDGTASGSFGVLSSPVLDVLSADISSGRNEVTGIVRLKSLAVDTDNVAKLGVRWSLVFTVQGVKYGFFARYTGYSEGPTPQWAGGMTVGGGAERANPDATFRREGNNLIWSVSRKAIGALKKPNQFFYLNNAGSGTLTFSADGASPKPNTKYLDKALSCLPSK